MKSIAILLAFVLFGGIESAAQTITFKYTPPTEGMNVKYESGYTFNMTMAAEMGGQVNTMEMNTKRDDVRQETFLALTEGKATKRKVVFETYDEQDSGPMGGGRGGRGGRQRPKPELNVPYIVETMDTNVTVTREDGSAVTPEADRFFREEYNRGAITDRIGRFLDGKPVTLNEPLSVEKELASSFMGRMRGEADLKEFTMTLIGKHSVGDIDCAVFRVKMVATMNQGPMLMDATLEGEVLIDPSSAWPISLSMKGPIIMNSANPDMNISGDGTFGGTKKWSYGK